MAKRFSSVEERFWSKVDKSGDCWLWTAALNSGGYGQIGIERKSVRAHRYSWELANGPIPDGMQVDHICLEKKCVRPEHLRLATPKQNCEHVPITSRNTSGYRGVSRDRNKWRAQLRHEGKSIYVGKYLTPEEAAEAARLARLELYTHNELDRWAA